jgi:hypothetical protein
MPFVMVPVPEEHVVAVMRHVVSLVNRASERPWDDEAVEELFLAADEPSRSLLSVVAQATLAGNELADTEAARALELELRDTLEILRELNEQAEADKRQALLGMRGVDEITPGGRKRTKRTVTMSEEVAHMVRAAERVARDVEPHPIDQAR